MLGHKERSESHSSTPRGSCPMISKVNRGSGSASKEETENKEIYTSCLLETHAALHDTFHSEHPEQWGAATVPRNLLKSGVGSVRLETSTCGSKEQHLGGGGSDSLQGRILLPSSILSTNPDLLPREPHTGRSGKLPRLDWPRAPPAGRHAKLGRTGLSRAASFPGLPDT